LTFGQKLLGCGGLLLWVWLSALSLLYGNLKSQTNMNQTIEIHSIVGLFLSSILYLQTGLPGEMTRFLKATLVSGVILAVSNYLFNWGLHLSKKKGVSSFLNQSTILASYLASTCCLNEGLNLIEAAGSSLLLTSTYFILIKP
jgi:hypothetical protein